MVLLSSRLGLVCATAPRSPRLEGHGLQSPFFQRYGSNLPSSLTRDHSSTLACSASLPVSVCGTGTRALRSRPFSPVWGHVTWRPTKVGTSPSRLRACAVHFHTSPPTRLDGARLAAVATLLFPAFVKRSLGGTGMSTRCPSVVARAYPLGPTNPPRISLAAEPSDFRWWGFAPHFAATRSGIRTRGRSTRAFALTSRQPRRSPTVLET